MKSFFDFLKEADPPLVIALGFFAMVAMALTGFFVVVLVHGPAVLK